MRDKNTITPADGGHIREQLSAYMDGALSGAEHEAVRVHMEGCALCRVEYEELGATRNMLRSVPVVAPPRAFTLTEEMAAPARPAGFWERLLSPRNGPRLATGSALSFALVVMLLVGNVLFIGGETFRMAGGPSAANAPTSTGEPGDLRFLEGQFDASTKQSSGTDTENAQPPQPQEGVGATGSTPAADAVMSASPQALGTNVPMAMPAPTATTATAGDIVMSTPASTREVITSVGEASPTPVAMSLNVMATATALSNASHYQAGEATAEAAGRAEANPARPQAAPAAEETAPGDGRGIYLGLAALFLGLGLLLGLGAIVARRKSSPLQ